MEGMPGRRDARWSLVISTLIVTVALVAPARGQVPSLPGPTPPADFATMVGGPESFAPPAADQPGLAPSYFAGEGAVPTAPRVEMSPLGTITESLFGDVYAAGRWHPLSFGSFFSEGWLEPWAGAPAGRDGLTPRHGWLGAFDGVFYRLWLTTFNYYNHLNKPFGGNGYSGMYQVFLPLSRRFEFLLTVPFVLSNGTQEPGRGYRSEFGDLVITPRFLLAETEATTQVFAMDVRTPTGTQATSNGIMALHPRYEFWTNPGGRWVVRGGSGVFVPMNQAQALVHTSYTGDLAIGRYFTPHDVPFGDLVIYAASNWAVPLDGASKNATYFSVGPGTRFHIADNFFFLNFWEFPLTGPQPFTYTMQVALLKVF